MRIAAGVLMLIYGVLLAFSGLFGLTGGIGGIPGSYLALYIFEIISGLSSLLGGVFCVVRRYWKACLSSALLLLLCMIYYMSTAIVTIYHDVTTLVAVILMVIGGIPPIVFICLRKREWSQSQV